MTELPNLDQAKTWATKHVVLACIASAAFGFLFHAVFF